MTPFPDRNAATPSVARTSGMNILKRIGVNVCVLVATAGVTYFVGELVHRLFETGMWRLPIG